MRMLLRWFFFLGFVFQGGIAFWAVIVIQRLRREHLVAMTMLGAIAANMTLKEQVEKIQAVKDDL